MSFRRRLIVATSTLTLGTLAFSLASVYVGVNRVQERILDRELATAADKEAGVESSMSEDHLAITSAPGPTANSAAPLPKYGVLFDPKGNIHTSTPTVNASFRAALLAVLGRPPGRPFDLTLGKTRLRAILVPLPEHDGWKLLFAVPHADVDRDDWLIGGSMLVVFVLALMAAVTAISVVMARLTRSHMTIANTALRVAEGDLSARVGIRDGDTEIVNLSKNIDEMVDRLQRIVESQHNFIAYAAHELRSPLTTICGSLALALRQRRTPEEYQRLIQDALDSARHLNHLAEDLLLLARIQAEEDEGVETVLVADVVYDAVQSVEGAATERGVAIRVREGTASVSGRPRDLERMVRNLVENAVRYSHRGGTIQIDASPADGEARIAIQDDGPGVPLAARERIFHPFVRGNDERDQGEAGAGLGLAIAREIARRHGGDIRLDATAKGARFIIALPAEPRARTDGAASEETCRSQSTTRPHF